MRTIIHKLNQHRFLLACSILVKVFVRFCIYCRLISLLSSKMSCLVLLPIIRNDLTWNCLLSNEQLLLGRKLSINWGCDYDFSNGLKIYAYSVMYQARTSFFLLRDHIQAYFEPFFYEVLIFLLSFVVFLKKLYLSWLCLISYSKFFLLLKVSLFPFLFLLHIKKHPDTRFKRY